MSETVRKPGGSLISKGLTFQAAIVNALPHAVIAKIAIVQGVAIHQRTKRKSERP